MLKLVRPHMDYIASYITALREGYTYGSDNQASEKEISIIENDPLSFLEAHCAPLSAEIILPNGQKVERVSQDNLWYVNDKTFIGRISVRPQLTSYWLSCRGHVGYGVRPAEQNKGHGTKMLEMALSLCKNQHQLEKILVTCNIANDISSRVIEKNGGVLEDIRQRPCDNAVVKRYWINL